MTELEMDGDALDTVRTAETLMALAELRCASAKQAAQSAQDEYDAARRVYTAAWRAAVQGVGAPRPAPVGIGLAA